MSLFYLTNLLHLNCKSVIKKGLVLLEWKYFPTPKILDPFLFSARYELRPGSLFTPVTCGFDIQLRSILTSISLSFHLLSQNSWCTAGIQRKPVPTVELRLPTTPIIMTNWHFGPRWWTAALLAMCTCRGHSVRLMAKYNHSTAIGRRRYSVSSRSVWQLETWYWQKYGHLRHRQFLLIQ